MEEHLKTWEFRRIEWLLAHAEMWEDFDDKDMDHVDEIVEMMINIGLFEDRITLHGIKPYTSRLLVKARNHAVMKGIIVGQKSDVQRLQRSGRAYPKKRPPRGPNNPVS